MGGCTDCGEGERTAGLSTGEPGGCYPASVRARAMTTTQQRQPPTAPTSGPRPQLAGRLDRHHAPLAGWLGELCACLLFTSHSKRYGKFSLSSVFLSPDSLPRHAGDRPNRQARGRAMGGTAGGGAAGWRTLRGDPPTRRACFVQPAPRPDRWPVFRSPCGGFGLPAPRCGGFRPNRFGGHGFPELFKLNNS